MTAVTANSPYFWGAKRKKGCVGKKKGVRGEKKKGKESVYFAVIAVTRVKKPIFAGVFGVTANWGFAVTLPSPCCHPFIYPTPPVAEVVEIFSLKFYDVLFVTGD